MKKIGFILGSLMTCEVLFPLPMNQAFWLVPSSPIKEETFAEQVVTPEKERKSIEYRREVRPEGQTSVQQLLSDAGIFVLPSSLNGGMISVSYQGYTSFCIKVYIDEILMNDPNTGDFDWNRLDISQIDRIEVREQPTLGEHSFACASIHIFTKQSEKLEAKISATSYDGSLLDNYSASVVYGSRLNKFHYTLFSSFVASENYYKTGDTVIPVNVWQPSKQFRAGTNLSYDFTDSRLSCSIDYTMNHLKYSQNNFKLNSNVETDHLASLGLFYSSPNWEFKLGDRLSCVKNLNNERVNPVYEKDEDTNASNAALVDLVYTFPFEMVQLKLLTGAELDSRFENNSHRILLHEGAQLQKQWSIDTWVQAGAEITYSSTQAKQGFYPKAWASVSYEGLHFSIFREVVFPTCNQLFYKSSSAVGNPSLEPETGVGFHVGFKSSKCPFWFRYRHSYYGSKIHWNSEGGKLVVKNINDANYDVVTCGIDLPFTIFTEDKNWGALTLTSQFTAISAKLASVPNKGNQIMWVPEVQAQFGLKYQQPDWAPGLSLSGVVNFVGTRFQDNENKAVFDSYWNVTLQGSYSWKNFTLSCRVDNLLDVSCLIYQSTDGNKYYLPSRSITVSVKFQK